eukprot:2726161-Alexandrium_andersonii.AAC.1
MPGPLQSIPELLDAPQNEREKCLTVEEPASGSASVPVRGAAGQPSSTPGPGNAAPRLQIPELKSPEYYHIGLERAEGEALEVASGGFPTARADPAGPRPVHACFGAVAGRE